MAASRGIRGAAGVLAVGAALLSAPLASAGPQCTQTGPTTTQCETNGSAQIVTSPPNINNGPYYPYGGFGFSLGGFGFGW
ncbi:hypothetical protein [Mycolicibacterium arenosum]|uniref:Keratin associated protein n=1 Tax=Mycolicibacterium arenosum TaxID=2952157 RepID=A0ABT1LXP8_9MYCO|nr:hypothetical protein [Mycolicibacterium sp. CAU 1645]MCP9271676.1 hypothetical protein [Mycolicibacterium sp. CAU 1645]